MAPDTQKSPLNLSPIPKQENPGNKKSQLLAGSKGVIIAVIFGLIAIAIGFSAVIGFKSANQYQGFIKKIEQQTEELKNEKNSDESATEESNPLPTTLP